VSSIARRIDQEGRKSKAEIMEMMGQKTEHKSQEDTEKNKNFFWWYIKAKFGFNAGL
jgi:hypothetical protein